MPFPLVFVQYKANGLDSYQHLLTTLDEQKEIHLFSHPSLTGPKIIEELLFLDQASSTEEVAESFSTYMQHLIKHPTEHHKHSEQNQNQNRDDPLFAVYDQVDSVQRNFLTPFTTCPSVPPMIQKEDDPYSQFQKLEQAIFGVHKISTMRTLLLQCKSIIESTEQEHLAKQKVNSQQWQQFENTSSLWNRLSSFQKKSRVALGSSLEQEEEQDEFAIPAHVVIPMIPSFVAFPKLVLYSEDGEESEQEEEEEDESAEPNSHRKRQKRGALVFETIQVQKDQKELEQEHKAWQKGVSSEDLFLDQLLDQPLQQPETIQKVKVVLPKSSSLKAAKGGNLKKRKTPLSKEETLASSKKKQFKDQTEWRSFFRSFSSFQFSHFFETEKKRLQEQIETFDVEEPFVSQALLRKLRHLEYPLQLDAKAMQNIQDICEKYRVQRALVRNPLHPHFTSVEMYPCHSIYGFEMDQWEKSDVEKLRSRILSTRLSLHKEMRQRRWLMETYLLASELKELTKPHIQTEESVFLHWLLNLKREACQSLHQRLLNTFVKEKEKFTGELEKQVKKVLRVFQLVERAREACFFYPGRLQLSFPSTKTKDIQKALSQHYSIHPVFQFVFSQAQDSELLLDSSQFSSHPIFWEFEKLAARLLRLLQVIDAQDEIDFSPACVLRDCILNDKEFNAFFKLSEKDPKQKGFSGLYIQETSCQKGWSLPRAFAFQGEDEFRGELWFLDDGASCATTLRHPDYKEPVRNREMIRFYDKNVCLSEKTLLYFSGVHHLFDYMKETYPKTVCSSEDESSYAYLHDSQFPGVSLLSLARTGGFVNDSTYLTEEGVGWFAMQCLEQECTHTCLHREHHPCVHLRNYLLRRLFKHVGLKAMKPLLDLFRYVAEESPLHPLELKPLLECLSSLSKDAFWNQAFCSLVPGLLLWLESNLGSSSSSSSVQKAELDVYHSFFKLSELFYFDPKDKKFHVSEYVSKLQTMKQHRWETIKRTCRAEHTSEVLWVAKSFDFYVSQHLYHKQLSAKFLKHRFEGGAFFDASQEGVSVLNFSKLSGFHQPTKRSQYLALFGKVVSLVPHQPNTDTQTQTQDSRVTPLHYAHSLSVCAQKWSQELLNLYQETTKQEGSYERHETVSLLPSDFTYELNFELFEPVEYFLVSQNKEN